MNIEKMEDGPGRFNASCALLFYSSEGGGSYVTLNEIEEGIILPGQLCDVNKLEDIVKGFSGDTDVGYCPDCWKFLYSTKTVKVWKSEAKKAKVCIAEDGEDKLKTIKIPELIWVWSERNTYVFTLKSEYKGPDTRLGVPKFFNVYPDGRICWGTSTPKKWDKVEYNFFNSKFTHTLQNCKFSCRSTLLKDETLGSAVRKVY